MLAKVVLIGARTDGCDKGPGCSSLLCRWTEKTFRDNTESTIGVEFATRTLSIPKHGDVKVQCWDLSTQERFRVIVRSYIPGAACACLVIDLASPHGADSLEPLFADMVHDKNKELGAFIVIGTKSDEALDANIVACKAFADKLNVPYCQVSAKTDDGAENALMAAVEVACTRGAPMMASARVHNHPSRAADDRQRKPSGGPLGGWGKKKKK